MGKTKGLSYSKANKNIRLITHAVLGFRTPVGCCGTYLYLYFMNIMNDVFIRLMKTYCDPDGFSFQKPYLGHLKGSTLHILL